MKFKLTALLVALLGVCSVWGNDGVYFTSGNFLVPVRETDISVAREVLTITIGKDSFARVDVYYELVNNGQPKTVTMAFEAEAPYNTGSALNRNGIHPYINNFTVTMNGNSLTSSNALVAVKNADGKQLVDYTPLDMTQWKGVGEVPDSLIPYENALYNASLDSVTAYAYAYYFKAPFQSGRNIVHHTYSYRMSYSVGQRFEIPYWLTPATRWANHKIDDFTLKITADDLTEFCMVDSVFAGTPFTAPSPSSMYHLTTDYGVPMLLASVCQGDTVTWHSKDFCPTSNISICSPEWDHANAYYTHKTSGRVVVDSEGNVSRYLANCGDSYFVEAQDYGLVKKSEGRILEYSADKGQGCLVISSDVASGRVNVRLHPTVKSRRITTLVYRKGFLPDVYPCLGLVSGADGWQWYKLKVGNKTGYVRQDLMTWDAIDTY